MDGLGDLNRRITICTHLGGVDTWHCLRRLEVRDADRETGYLSVCTDRQSTGPRVNVQTCKL